MNLSESVIMPREDFIELSTVAFDNHHIPSAGERLASTAQTALVLASIAGAVTAGTWGWAKAMDWLEQKNFDRAVRNAEAAKQSRSRI